RFLVGSDDLCLIFRFVLEANRNFRRLIDDMVIRQNVPGLLHDEAGTKTPGLFITVWKIGSSKEIKKIEWVELSGILIAIAVAVRAVSNWSFGSGLSADVDNRRSETRSDLRKCVRHRDRIGDDERLRFLLARFNPTRDDRSDDNADREGCNNQGEIKQSRFCH